MNIIDTTNPGHLSLFAKELVYNGIDAAILHDIIEVTKKQLDPDTEKIYNFELLMQAPSLTMMRRGVKVNIVTHSHLIQDLEDIIRSLEVWINRMAYVLQGSDINPRSPTQLQELLYRTLNLPKIYKGYGPNKRITTDRNALERLQGYLIARPIIKAILALRDATKKLGVLKASLDKTGRFRTSFNVAGTATGRWSSSKAVTGEGTNAQNITSDLRSIFIPDPGFKLAYADLEQAESRVVAYDAEDEAYIAACESSDLHTAVAKMVWPDLQWSDDLVNDRRIADQIYIRHFSYRDIAKRLGHASNYKGKASELAKRIGVDTTTVEQFQARYFRAFSGIPKWWRRIERTLQTTATFITPLNRRRTFFDRADDLHTFKSAISYIPQSTVADILNKSLYIIWRDLDGENLQILLQIHDAIVFQYRESRRDLVGSVLDRMQFPVFIHGREMVIPAEIKVGYDWKDMKAFGSDQSQVRPEINLLNMVL